MAYPASFAMLLESVPWYPKRLNSDAAASTMRSRVSSGDPRLGRFPRLGASYFFLQVLVDSHLVIMLSLAIY